MCYLASRARGCTPMLVCRTASAGQTTGNTFTLVVLIVYQGPSSVKT